MAIRSDIDLDDDKESSDSADYMDDEDNDEEDGEDNDDAKACCKRIYVPNKSQLTETDDAEQLECDYSAYMMYHKAETGFPCLSFDVLPDQLGDGEERAQSFPLTTYLVAGTQADKDHLNRVLVLKFFNMEAISNQEESDDDDDDEEEEERLPDLHCASLPHAGCVNRIRATKIGDKLIAADWSDHGAVHLWDLSEALGACDGDAVRVADFNKRQGSAAQPIFTFTGHRAPGFGIDWSPVVEGTLATGDCNCDIFLWKLNAGQGWTVDQLPLSGHTDSVEDLQWSPNEPHILSSCSVDRSIRVWDVRCRRQSALTIPEAHQSDVNVISWNRVEKAFLLSGGDDGAIKVWDLRQVRTGPSRPVATFKQHRGPITSVDWHRTDGTVFAAAGEDHQVTQWDLAVEADDDSGGDNPSGVTALSEDRDDSDAVRQLPPQLLFIHQGQREVKEVRWHPQIPGLLISTAATGFDIFRTVSV